MSPDNVDEYEYDDECGESCVDEWLPEKINCEEGEGSNLMRDRVSYFQLSEGEYIVCSVHKF